VTKLLDSFCMPVPTEAGRVGLAASGGEMYWLSWRIDVNVRAEMAVDGTTPVQLEEDDSSILLIFVIAFEEDLVKLEGPLR
jgi:hypothetical protein